jgi:hypothetical protein
MHLSGNSTLFPRSVATCLPFDRKTIPDAVIVTVKLPSGIESLVSIVRVEEQVGLQEAEEKEAVAPMGKPEPEKRTA